MESNLISSQISALAGKIKKPTIAVLGSHSALDICQGARAVGIPNIVVCQKGRDAIYSKHYKVRKPKGASAPLDTLGCVEDVMLLNKFSDIANPTSVASLNKRQALFVPHRSFSVYVGYEKIEKNFTVPILGNRWLLRAEERTAERNQYYLLNKADVRIPKKFSSPDKIDSLAIIKAPEATRSYERAFFFAANPEQYRQESQRLLREGRVTPEGLKSAVIEEFILGAPFNFNFFYSSLTGELELLGIDTRRQTNLDGVLRLPAAQQLEATRHAIVNNIEVGHIACTLRESLLEQVFDMGERFVRATEREYPPGPIGPFALQGAIAPAEKGEEIVIFDVSFRVPGSPGTRFTPYSEYLHNQSISVGRRIALEVQMALKQKRMDEIVT